MIQADVLVVACELERTAVVGEANGLSRYRRLRSRRFRKHFEDLRRGHAALDGSASLSSRCVHNQLGSNQLAKPNVAYLGGMRVIGWILPCSLHYRFQQLWFDLGCSSDVAGRGKRARGFSFSVFSTRGFPCCLQRSFV